MLGFLSKAGKGTVNYGYHGKGPGEINLADISSGSRNPPKLAPGWQSPAVEPELNTDGNLPSVIVIGSSPSLTTAKAKKMGSLKGD
jgi:hypothetical protein